MYWSDDLLQALVNTCVGRMDSYVVQRENGQYYRVKKPLTYDLLRSHLGGELTLGTYPIREDGLCSFVVFDADDKGGTNGFEQMCQLRQMLAALSVPSYLEQSRRGAHLRVFLETGVDPALLRAAFLSYAPAGVEFFPAQSQVSFEHPGYAVRLPLGIHRKSGRRYPFLVAADEGYVPVARTLADTLFWLGSVERVSFSVVSALSGQHEQVEFRLSARKGFSGLLPGRQLGGSRWLRIEDWNAEQDPFALIGRYVELDARGEGHCPFSWHHSDGVDSHPSFVVYAPSRPSRACWYCRAWGQGGSAFDFLKLYYGWSASELWHRILSGEQF
jgi:hypothetical protein